MKISRTRRITVELLLIAVGEVRQQNWYYWEECWRAFNFRKKQNHIAWCL